MRKAVWFVENPRKQRVTDGQKRLIGVLLSEVEGRERNPLVQRFISNSFDGFVSSAEPVPYLRRIGITNDITPLPSHANVQLNTDYGLYWQNFVVTLFYVVGICNDSQLSGHDC